MNKYLEKIASIYTLEKEAYIKGFSSNRTAIRSFLEDFSPGKVRENLLHMRAGSKGRVAELEDGFIPALHSAYKKHGRFGPDSDAHKELLKKYPTSMKSILGD